MKVEYRPPFHLGVALPTKHRPGPGGPQARGRDPEAPAGLEADPVAPLQRGDERGARAAPGVSGCRGLCQTYAPLKNQCVQ